MRSQDQECVCDCSSLVLRGSPEKQHIPFLITAVSLETVGDEDGLTMNEFSSSANVPL